MTDTWYHSAGAFGALELQEEFIQPAALHLNKTHASTRLWHDRTTLHDFTHPPILKRCGDELKNIVKDG